MMKLFKTGTVVGGIFAVIIAFLVVSIVCAVPVWFLWNWLMPMIFGLVKLNLIEAWGLTVLTGFLFKSPTSIDN